MRKFLGVTALVAAGLMAGMASMASAADTIAVIMKGPGAGNPFWAAVQRGAEEQGKKMGVNIVVLAPPSESDVAAQIALIAGSLNPETSSRKPASLATASRRTKIR